MDEEIAPYVRKGVKVVGNARFHHQNPFNLRTLIDADRAKGLGGKKRSNSNFSREPSHVSRQLANDKSSRGPKSKSAHGNEKSADFEPKNVHKRSNRQEYQQENSNDAKKFYILTDDAHTHPPSPPNDINNIPLPWKSAAVCLASG